MTPPIRAGVLTISDRCSAGLAPDTSGPALCEMLREHLAADVIHTACTPDDSTAISTTILRWAADAPSVDLILSTGGTGLAPRDVTPEAVLPLLERTHPGIMELARLRCYPRTPRAFLSRGIAGTIRRTLVLTLPGSPRGCTEMLDALLDVLPHAILTLRGDGQDDGHQPFLGTTGA